MHAVGFWPCFGDIYGLISNGGGVRCHGLEGAVAVRKVCRVVGAKPCGLFVIMV
jgi:hypothetical protein